MAHQKSSELDSVPENLASLKELAVPAPIRPSSKAVSHSRKSTERSSNERSIKKKNENPHENRSSENYDIPDGFINLDELALTAPVQNPHERHTYHEEFLEDRRSHEQTDQHSANLEHDKSSSENYDIPGDFMNLDELASTSPVQNPHERHTYHEEFVEDRRSRGQSDRRDADQEQVEISPPNAAEESSANAPSPQPLRASKLVTVSYLVLFSILGTLARLGLQTLTAYAGSPVLTSELW
jgi:hypothetical protein